MSYFNHAFKKVFVGTGGFNVTANQSTSQMNVTPAKFGFFDPSTNVSVVSATGLKCPLYLASSSLYANDKIGPFYGGKKETNKSKLINPKYVNGFYKVNSNAAQQNVIHIGTTNYTNDGVTALAITTAGAGLTNGTYTNVPLVDTTAPTGLGLEATITVKGGIVTKVVITNPGTGWITADVVTPAVGFLIPGTTQPTFTVTAALVAGCKKDFLCGETYDLRVEVKGEAVLRFLNHHAYYTLSAYTGCCAGLTPTAVDSTLVMIDWANQIIGTDILKSFVLPIVTAEDGKVYYAPGTDTSLITPPAGLTIGGTWNEYVSTGHTLNATAGLTLVGSYVDTKFGNCSFQVLDNYINEPVRLYASLVDQKGEPCEFEGLCVVTECEGLMPQGLGETILRELILSESYRQDDFHSNIRMREIEGGDQILNAINRNSLYTTYRLVHSVPRFNNPSGTFDNDQYELEIVVTGSAVAAFETFVNTWLDNAGNCTQLKTLRSSPGCVPVIPVP
jgi:hypothetical protein